jgi:ATP-dependent DNA ligase
VASLIPFMLCERLTDVRQLDPRFDFIAEPKLDGQRAQLHIAKGRAAACYSRPGHDLLRHSGMAWLTALDWPVRAAALDGKVCAGDGRGGIHSVFEARQRTDDGSM